ncbi:MAG: hypothetical protein J6Y03_02265 [Alphaproteobacteria bacterium]|nr:hypothetical protein [Alphaproteobacteria bacterium]
MIKNKTFMIACIGALIAFPAFAQEPLIVRNDAIIVCRSKQCKSARDTMTREFLYNKLGSLLKNNVNKKMLLCDADPTVHVCLNNALAFKARAGATITTVRIPSALVVDAKSLPNDMSQQFVLDYSIKLGNTYPTCQAALNQMQIISTDEINVETPGFECRFTENGMTLLNASYEIDYIDFDYGILGAYYTIAAGQVSRGGQTGYALLRFENSSNGTNEAKEEDCGCKKNCGKKEGGSSKCGCDRKPPKVKTIVKEKVVKQYEVAPIEVFVKTKAPIEDGQVQSVRINGVDVPNVPVISEAPVQPTYNQKFLKVGVPVVLDVENETSVDEVGNMSVWDN